MNRDGMTGIEAARGQYIVISDADDSYDFGEIPKLVEKLRSGFSIVQGCRLPSGGGRILPNTMPLLQADLAETRRSCRDDRAQSRHVPALAWRIDVDFADSPDALQADQGRTAVGQAVFRRSKSCARAQ